MTPSQKPKLAKWGRAAVVVAVGLAAAGVFALITPSHELDTEAFLELVYVRRAEVRSVHVTHTGSMTMSNGDVHHTRGEIDALQTGDSQGYIEYEGCSFPTGREVYLCKTEWVELGGVRYERQTTSEGPGEWEIPDFLQTQPNQADSPRDSTRVPDYWSRRYGLVELDSETVEGVEYRRFRTSYHPGRRMLERLESGELELPPEIPLESLAADLKSQLETETGTVKLWARADDSTIWKITFETERSEVDDGGRLGIPTSVKSTSTMEYSRYNEPVVIRPPI